MHREFLVGRCLGQRLSDAWFEDALLVHLHQVVAAHDGGDGSELEHPPDEQLNGHQRVAYPCHDCRDEHDGERDTAIDLVAQRHVATTVLECEDLPDGEEQEQGRKDDVDQRVGDQDDAEPDHEERHEDEGQVDLGPFAALASVEAHGHREVDGSDEPCHFDHQTGGHDHEVGAHEGAHYHDGDGDDEGGNKHIEKHEDARSHDDGAAPVGLVGLTFAVDSAFVAQRLVLGAEVHLHAHPIAREALKDGEVVGAGIDEDVLLEFGVFLLGVVVEFLDLVGHLGVVLIVLLEFFEHVLDDVAYALGINDTRVAVGDAKGVEHERTLHLLGFFPVDSLHGYGVSRHSIEGGHLVVIDTTTVHVADGLLK